MDFEDLSVRVWRRAAHEVTVAAALVALIPELQRAGLKPDFGDVPVDRDDGPYDFFTIFCRRELAAAYVRICSRTARYYAVVRSLRNEPSEIATDSPGELVAAISAIFAQP